jgi:hypothetical protein
MRYTGSFVSSLFSACAALTLCAGTAHAQNYSFIESGFSEGATLSGTFTATDLDGSGAIEYLFTDLDPEVTDFSATFSGNSIVDSFQLTFYDLAGLVYDPQGYFFTPNLFGFGASNGQALAISGLLDECDGIGVCAGVTANRGDSDGGDPDFSALAAVVTAVPEPTTWGMMLLGFALVGGTMRGSLRRAQRALA